MIRQQTTKHEADARNRFDDWSESSTFQRLRPWLAYVQKNILGELNWDRVTRVLDVACGSGWAVFEMARRMNSRPNAMACGCDISEGMDMRNVEENRVVAENADYNVIATHTLPRETWVEGYYEILEPRAESLLDHSDEAVRDFASETMEEIRIFGCSEDSYGYVFYVMEKA